MVVFHKGGLNLTMVVSKLQTLIYSTLPQTTVVVGYAVGPWKFFIDQWQC